MPNKARGICKPKPYLSDSKSKYNQLSDKDKRKQRFHQTMVELATLSDLAANIAERCKELSQKAAQDEKAVDDEQKTDQAPEIVDLKAKIIKLTQENLRLKDRIKVLEKDE